MGRQPQDRPPLGLVFFRAKPLIRLIGELSRGKKKWLPLEMRLVRPLDLWGRAKQRERATRAFPEANPFQRKLCAGGLKRRRLGRFARAIQP
jgi:hypothetical protein